MRSRSRRDCARSTRFPTFYIADLDAIEGRAPNTAALARLRAMPDAPELWVDAGFADEKALAAALAEPSLRPVLGSESQRDDALLRRFRDHPDLILSLDFFADEFRGPPSFLEEPDVLAATRDRHDAGQSRFRRRSRFRAAGERSRRRPETAMSSPPAAYATKPTSARFRRSASPRRWWPPRFTTARSRPATCVARRLNCCRNWPVPKSDAPSGTERQKPRSFFNRRNRPSGSAGGCYLCGAVSCLGRERMLYLVPLGGRFGRRRRPATARWMASLVAW